MNKKGNLSLLQNLVIGLVVISFVLAVGLIMVGKLKDIAHTNGYVTAEEAINATEDAITEIPSWLTVVVIAFVAVIILGVVYMFARGKTQ
jgi:hypothetical protein